MENGESPGGARNGSGTGTAGVEMGVPGATAFDFQGGLCWGRSVGTLIYRTGKLRQP